MTESGLTKTSVIVIIVMALLFAIIVKLLQPTYYTYKFEKEAKELYASVKKEIEERQIDDVSSINASNIQKVLGIKLKNIEQITISFDENNKLVISVQANRNASKKVIQVKEEELIEVKDKDVIAPLMTLKGKIKIKIELNEEYIELGAVANDYIDGDLTSKIVITSNIDNKVVGTYYVTYSVSDSSGNNGQLKDK